MNVIDMIKYAKIAWQDEGQVKALVNAAKKLEGPKPSWQTGEFWVNQVVPTLVVIFGGLSGVIPPMWFVIGLLVLSTMGYFGRTALKIAHLWSGSASALDPDVVQQVGGVAKTFVDVVSAVKEAKGGNLDAAKTEVNVLNAAGPK